MPTTDVIHSSHWSVTRPGESPPASTETQIWWVPPTVPVPGAVTRSEAGEASRRPQGPVLDQWLRTRRAVREILGGILQKEPLSLRIDRTESGKPYLADFDLHFSVSHSGEHIVIAVGQQSLGVDVEIFGRERLSLEVADRYFPAAETQWLRNLRWRDRPEFFTALG